SSPGRSKTFRDPNIPTSQLRASGGAAYIVHYYSGRLSLPELSDRPPPRALPRGEQLRPLRGDDAGAIRDRAPGDARRHALGGLPVPLRAAGSHEGARHLRAVPAALRVEPRVRLAPHV